MQTFVKKLSQNPSYLLLNPYLNSAILNFHIKFFADMQKSVKTTKLLPQNFIVYGISWTVVSNRTGTVKAGSYILAINGESLSGKTILQVEEMLENCGNAVTLKIKKSIKQSSKLYSFYRPLVITDVTEPRSKQPSPVGRVSSTAMSMPPGYLFNRRAEEILPIMENLRHKLPCHFSWHHQASRH